MTLRSIFRYLLNPRVQMQKLPSSLKPVGSGFSSETLPRRPLWVRLRRVLFNLPLMVGGILIFGLFLIVLFGPLWSPHDHFITVQTMVPHYDAELGKLVSPPFPPSAEHWLGTDKWGNDSLSLIFTGARVTLVVCAYITAARMFLGILLGSLAGWRAGSATDRVLMGIAGVISSVPMLLSSMIMIFAIGIQKGTWVFIAALTIVGWTEIAEVIRGEMLVIREKTYIEGAQAVGLNGLQVVVRHAFPNLLAQVLVLSSLEMGAVLVLLAELGFLQVFIGGGSTFTMDPTFGRGPVPLMEVPEWGAMLGMGSSSLRSAYYLVMAPALAFFISVAGFNALGEGLRRFMGGASVNTALLLKKRVLLMGVGLAVISSVVVSYTGPVLSYRRVARTFDAVQARDAAQQLASLASSVPENIKDNPSAAYIAEKFQEAGLERGDRSAIASNYITTVETQRGSETLQVPVVLGYLKGYDNEIADELVIVMAAFDGLPGAGTLPDQKEWAASGVGLLIGMANVWQEQNIDSRRSVLFVAWGGGNSDFSGALTFIDNPRHFETLPIPSRQTVVPHMLIQIAADPAGEPALWLLPESDKKLAGMFASSAQEMGASLDSQPLDFQLDEDSYSPDLPSIFLRWSQDPAPVGQALTLTLIKIVREAIYW